jgi:hypothetical protein
VATANNSASGARSALSESNTPNSQERIAWLKRKGSDALRDKSIASRTRTVSGTLIPAKTISHSSRCIQCIEAKSRLAPMCSAQPSCSENQYFLVSSLSSFQTACAYEIRNHVPSLGTPLICAAQKALPIVRASAARSLHHTALAWMLFRTVLSQYASRRVILPFASNRRM